VSDGRNYHIRDSLDGASLAQALKQLVSGSSWSQAKQLVAKRHVHVNGNLCIDEGRRLKTGDVVKIFDAPRARPLEASDVVIRYRDEHLVVVEKPAGVNSLRHAEERDWPAHRRAMQPSLDELVNASLFGGQDAKPQRPQKTRSPHPQRKRPARQVRPVHRLDRDTSGLMLFALSPEAEQRLEQMFAKHAIERIYRAVVYGHVTEAMTIESHFVRDRGDGLRGSVDSPAEDSQRAVTHVTPIELFTSRSGEPYSIVECKLETGRTHQIRIHLAERGRRLCGEKMYNKPLGEKPLPDVSGAPRQALHSARVKFDHPITGLRIQLQSDWPVDLAKWLRDLRA
jgi:23S rRNA pseudouridine1911/1915/1917 synthase